MTPGEQAINDVVHTIGLAFAELAIYTEKSQANKNFSRLGLATTLTDTANRIDKSKQNGELMATILLNYAANLRGEASKVKVLPFQINQ